VPVVTAHALYRFYGAEDDLLYVGITVDPGRRWTRHRSDKLWWTEVARIQIDQFPDRPSVLAAELEAIEQERPRYNIMHASATGGPADVPSWPGCSVCGAAAWIWAVDTWQAFAYHRLKAEHQDAIRARNNGLLIYTGVDLVDGPRKAPWLTFCPEHADRADYGFPVGDWRATVAHVGHLLDQHPTTASGSYLGPFL
jgi:hypothetical protein